MDSVTTPVSAFVYHRARYWLYLVQLMHSLKWTLWGVITWCAAAIAGIFVFLPVWAHTCLLITGLFAVSYYYYRALRTVPYPSIKQAEQAIEQNSRLKHQPFAARRDVLLGGDAAIWAHHQQQANGWLRGKLSAIALPTIVSSLGAAAAILFTALFFSPWITQKITSSFSPAVQVVGITHMPVITGWVEAPSYLKQPPLTLPEAGKSTNVPKGARLVLSAPLTSLPVWVTMGGRKQKFTHNTEKSMQQLTVPLVESGTVQLHAGIRAAPAWQFKVIADAPPTIAFSDTITRNQRGSISLPFIVTDDNGVAAVRVHITPAMGAQYVKTIMEWQDAPKNISTQVTQDFSALSFAGQTVRLRLIAKDISGQETRTEAISFAVPEYTFTNQTAITLAALRKRLIEQTMPVVDVDDALTALITEPVSHFGKDIIAYSAVFSATKRLQFYAENPPLLEITELLWQAALHLEQGNTSGALQNVREAADSLRQELAKKNPNNAVIAKKLQEFQKALQSYLQQIAKNGTPKGSPTPMVDAKSLGNFMERLQNLAAMGKGEQALKELDALQQMMENLQTPQELSPAAKKALALLEELQDVTAAQRALLQKTAKNTDEKQLLIFEKAQQKLAEQLGKIQEQGKELSLPLEGLESAGDAMRQSVRNLQEQQQVSSIDAQHKVVNLLEKTMQQAMKKMQAQNPFLQLPQQQGAGMPTQSRYPVPDAAEANQLRNLMGIIQEKVPQTEGKQRQYLERLLGE